MKTVLVQYSYRVSDERFIEVPDSVDVEELQHDEERVLRIMAKRAGTNGEAPIDFSDDEEVQVGWVDEA